MIPLLNSEVEYLDVQENAIWVSGEEDGSFDAEDFVLFYAEGSDQWNEESQTHRNIFADRTFYYLTTSLGSGKRITEANQPTGTPDEM